MFLVINVSRIELVMREFPPSLRPPDERIHHMLHCDIMITFIGLDRPSAAPSVVIPSHTAKVTTKNEGSPQPSCLNTRSTRSIRLASSVVKEKVETLGTECNVTPSLRRGTELTLTCGTAAWRIVQLKEMMLDTEHTHTHNSIC